MNGENTAKAFLSFNTNFNYFWQLRKNKNGIPRGDSMLSLCGGTEQILSGFSVRPMQDRPPNGFALPLSPRYLVEVSEWKEFDESH